MQQITRRTMLSAGAAMLVGRPAFLRASAKMVRVFVGTFTDPLGGSVPSYFPKRESGGGSRGVYTFAFDTGTGRAGDISLAAEVSNPINLIVHASGRVLYACRWPTERDGRNL